MKKFNSKIDLWWILPLSFPLFHAIEGMIYLKWYGFLTFAGLIFFICIISKTTSYTIIDNLLIIKCLWIVNEKIDIGKITKLEKTTSILSAPALSLSRMKIKYNKYDEILISPKENPVFIDALLQVNPYITVDSYL